MQALKQNSSVTGAMTKLRKICNGAMLSVSDLPDSALCSKGPANELAVNSVGWMTACSKPVLRSPNRLNSNLWAKSVCITTQMSACSHTHAPVNKCSKVSCSDSSLMLQTISLSVPSILHWPNVSCLYGLQYLGLKLPIQWYPSHKTSCSCADHSEFDR